MRKIAAWLVLVVVFSVGMTNPALAQGDLMLQSVDGEDFPLITLGVTLPADMFQEGALPEFKVEENGRLADVESMESVFAEREPIDIILLIDTSGSMADGVLDDAKEAALRFIGSMGESDEIAVIGFSASPVLAAGFTTDRSLLTSAIEGLRASGETAVYDTIVEAVRLLMTRETSQQNIVLLSDGGDTVSGSSLDDAVHAVRTAGAPIFAVALESPEFNPSALQVVSDGSGGRLMTVSDPSGLVGLFEGIAQELQNLYMVTYRSQEPNTKDIELDITATTGSQEAVVSVVIRNPLMDRVGDSSDVVEQTREQVMADPRLMTLAVGLLFVAVALLVMAMVLMAMRSPSALSQLEFYDSQGSGLVGEAANANGDTSHGKMMSAVGYVAGKRGFTMLIHERLERASLPLRAVEFIYFHVLAVIAVGVLVQVLTGTFALSLLFVVVATIGPLIALDAMAVRRKRAFEEQLPEILQLLAGSLRAGWGILQAIELVVKEIGPPSAPEFQRVETEARLGMPVSAALEKMAERVDSNDLRWAVSAINIQREVGGNLAEVLDIVADTMRERANLRRQVQALTAEGRLSAIILVALPFVLLFVILMTNPFYMSQFFDSPMGLAMAVAGIVLMIVGVIWLRKVIQVEV